MPYAKDKKCWVVGCESSTSVLHYLVQRPDMDEWIERIGRAESKKTMSTRELWSKGVCRRHFAGGFLKGFLKLKAGAVPELFLPDPILSAGYQQEEPTHEVHYLNYKFPTEPVDGEMTPTSFFVVKEQGQVDSQIISTDDVVGLITCIPVNSQEI